MQMQRKNILGTIIFLIVCVVLFILLTGQKTEPVFMINDTALTNRAENAEDLILRVETTEIELMVHVAGAVENPGVYTLLQGQRVEDAIQKAGISENANVDALNRAALLSDGQKIVVPVRAESSITVDQEPNQTFYEVGAQKNSKINLNQATMVELMNLPGIGEVKAQAILQYRKEHGSFQSVEELLQVNGIGNSIYAQISEMVFV